MPDKEIVVKGIEWIINHKEMLYKRNKNFDDHELTLLNKTSLAMERALIIHKSNKWSTIPLTISILYSHLSSCWEYLTDEEWQKLVDEIMTWLSEWKNAVELEDKESLYESMRTMLSYSGNIVMGIMFTGKRKITPEEWEKEKTLKERDERIEGKLSELEGKLNKQVDITKFILNRIDSVEKDIAEIKR